MTSQIMKNIFKYFFPRTLHRCAQNSFGKYDIVKPWTVSAKRTVPDYIPKPSYAHSSVPPAELSEPEIKNESQIECMRNSCYLAMRILRQMKNFVEPGITTDKLDEIAHELIISNGAYPSPLNYKGFPKSICTSVNNVALHGIPDNRPLQEGDTLNIDITVYFNGYHGDCSTMFEVGEVDTEAKQLINVTEMSLNNAIQICKPNENFSSIGRIIEETAINHGYNVIPECVGHGIGTYFHSPPYIYHVENDFEGKMLPGMTFTIEPTITQGTEDITILADKWTIITNDNARTAQIEHTILITDTGCDILTQ